MENGIKTKEFVIKPFPVDFHIMAYDNEDGFLRYYVNNGHKLNESSLSGNSDWAYVHHNGSTVYIVLYTPELKDIGKICHEAIHAADCMLQIIGQPEHTITGDELIPYYADHIVNEIIDFLIEEKIITITYNTIENE